MKSLRLDTVAPAILIKAAVKMFCLGNMGLPELLFILVYRVCHKKVLLVGDTLERTKIFNKEGLWSAYL
jgi:hypothetical protein